MPAGRPRKSLVAKKLIGTDRPDRRKKPDLSERLQKPPPPPHRLSKHAKAAWRRVAASAFSLGTLRGSDLEALALLSEALGTAAQAQETLEAEGLTTEAASGGAKAHPAIAVLQSSRALADRMLGHFGLNPHARGSVDVRPPLPSYGPPVLAHDNSEPEMTLREFLAEGDERHAEDMRKYNAFHNKEKQKK